MDLVVAWLVFPLVLLALAAGWGFAIEHTSGGRLPGVLSLPVGFAAIVVVSGLVTMIPSLAHLAVPVVTGGAAAGLAAAWPWRRPTRAAVWPAAAAALVFAAYAAPIVLSGEATYAGFITLDDTATFFAMTDRMLEDGRTVDGLAPSTYEATLGFSLMSGYPMGSLLPLGIGARLVGEDIAWLFQPYLAVTAALLALVLWQLLAAQIAPAWWRLVAVVVASQPALLYAYAMWTGVKELVAALLLALVAALAFERRSAVTLRGWIPLVTAAAATLGALSLGGAVWLLPVAVWLLVDSRASLRVRDIAIAAALLVVLALPAISTAARLLGDGYSASWAREDEMLANLIRPLEAVQALGVWPAGDFRLRPEQYGPTLVLVVLVGGLAAAGLLRSFRARTGLFPYAVCALSGAGAYWALTGPWIEAKAFAIASPAFLALAAAGCSWLAGSGRRVEAAVAATFVGAGVLWSNAYAYSNVSLAPRGQLAELEAIGDDFARQGPALMTEYLPVGARHFLRRLDAEAAAELRRHVVPLRDGSSLPKSGYANLDSFQLDGVLFYPTLVLRRSPFENRPSAPYELVRQGRWYEVWQRPERYRPIREHVPLGDAFHPGAAPACDDVVRLATPGSSLVAVPRDDPALIVPSLVAGQAYEFDVRRRGRYSVWLAGSTRRRATAFVDAREIGSVDSHLNNTGQLVELGDVALLPGRHTVEARFARERLRPGTVGPEYGAGMLVVAPTREPREVVTVEADKAASLCGRTLDWVEALG